MYRKIHSLFLCVSGEFTNLSNRKGLANKSSLKSRVKRHAQLLLNFFHDFFDACPIIILLF